MIPDPDPEKGNSVEDGAMGAPTSADQPRWLAGYCDKTEEQDLGDCSFDIKGILPLPVDVWTKDHQHAEAAPKLIFNARSEASRALAHELQLLVVVLC